MSDQTNTTPGAEEAELAAKLTDLQAAGWRLVAEYRKASIDPPAKLLRFVGVVIEREPRGVRNGPKPVVLPKIVAWFAERDNAPATYKDISGGTGISVNQVRTCISRNEAQCFERAGDHRDGDKLRALVKLSAAGLSRLNA